jgi:hypothetical protein
MSLLVPRLHSQATRTRIGRLRARFSEGMASKLGLEAEILPTINEAPKQIMATLISPRQLSRFSISPQSPSAHAGCAFRFERGAAFYPSMLLATGSADHRVYIYNIPANQQVISIDISRAWRFREHSFFGRGLQKLSRSWKGTGTACTRLCSIPPNRSSRRAPRILPYGCGPPSRQ